MVCRKPQRTPASYLAAIKEENLVKVATRDRRDSKTFEISKLENSGFFIGLANTYVHSQLFDEGIQLFEEMQKKGSDESTMLNDYGGSLLFRMLSRQSFNKSDLDLARKLIFGAYDFDKRVASNPYDYPAYKNLCFLRAVEAHFYYNQMDFFAAFVLGWMSIEMTITRIWHKFLALKAVNGKPLRNFNIYSIIKTLNSSYIDDKLKVTKKDLEDFKKEVNDLEYLREKVRNKLLHGDMDNPSSDQALKCLKIAASLWMLFQSVDQDIKSMTS